MELSPAPKVEEEPMSENNEDVDTPDEKQISILEIQENDLEADIEEELPMDGIPPMNISSEEYH